MKNHKPKPSGLRCGHFESLESRTLLSGGLDPTFGKGGIVQVPNTNGFPQIATEKDHSVIYGDVGAQYTFEIRHFNADGSVDRSFGTNGVVETAINGEAAQLISLLIQPDGKIVAAGDLGTSNGNAEVTSDGMAVVRYNTNGTLDKTFGSAGIVMFANDSDPTLAWQNGKLLVLSANTLRRLSTNGTVDPTFHAGDPGGISIAVQADGKILAGEGRAGISAIGTIARYNADGSADSAFGTNGTLGLPGAPYQIGIEPDGTIVTMPVGYIPHSYGASALFAVTSSGAADNGFGTDGAVNLPEIGVGYEFATGMVLQPDGKVLVIQAELVPAGGGLFPYTTGGTEVLRFLPNGTLDTSFGSGGKIDIPDIAPPAGGEFQFAGNVAIDGTGRLLIAGSSIMAITTTNPVVAKPGTITGYMFNDTNGNGKKDPGEGPLNWTCYLDVNNDGKFDAGDYRVYTNSAGQFTIGNLPPGVYHIRQSQVAHWQKTTPAEYTVTISAGETVSGVIFGSRYVG